MTCTRSLRLLCCLTVVLLTSCKNPTEVNEPIHTSAVPVAVAGNLTFVSIAAAALHTCALATSGAAYCWGDGPAGSSSLVPTRVPGSLTFTALTPSCGLTAAGEVYCWMNRSLPPMRIAGDVRFASISSGVWSSCGLNAEGVPFCWHWENQEFTTPFRLRGDVRLVSIHQGLGFARTCGLTPEGLGHCWFSGGHEPMPGDLRFSSLSVGSSYQCGISGGSTYCWGLNEVGKLGIGTTQDAAAPQRVAGQHVFSSLSAGEDHTCALTAEGVAYCWGLNSSGQLGYRTEETCTVRVPFHDLGPASCARAPGPVATDLRFVAVSSGTRHTCGLTHEGKAYCWGQRSLLGDGRRY